MPPITIDTQDLTADLLRPDDNPVLADAVMEVIAPLGPVLDGAGFDNRV